MLLRCCLHFFALISEVAGRAESITSAGSVGVDGICHSSDDMALFQSRMQVSFGGNMSDSSPGFTHADAVPNPHDESDVGLEQVQVRRAPLARSWMSLRQQRPEVIHYDAQDFGTKEGVRICFVLVNTLHHPEKRFGEHKKFRYMWEFAFPTPRELGDLYFKHEDSAAKFIHAASYGKVALSGTVVGWYNDTTEDDITANDMFHQRDKYFLLAHHGVNIKDYDILALVGLTSRGLMQRGWDRSHSVIDPDCDGDIDECSVVKNIGMTFLINAGMFRTTRLQGNPYLYAGVLPSKSWAHEIVHALGSLGHDNALMCGDSPIAEHCRQVNYANQFSIMGKSNLGQHPSCQAMAQVGWLQGDEIEEVTLGEEDQNFTLTPRSVTGGGLKCLKVNLPVPFGGISSYPKPFGVLWIDHRQALGFDKSIGWLDKSVPFPSGDVQQWIGSNKSIRRDGVLLTLAPSQEHDDMDSSHRRSGSHRRRFAWGKSELIDVHADSTYRDDLATKTACKGKFADAALVMGETLKCKYLGMEVQVLSVGTGGAVVNLRKNLHMTGCPVPQSLSTEETAGSISADDALIARSSHSSAIAQKPLEMIQEVMETQNVDPPTSLSECHIVSVEVVSDKWRAESSWTIEDPNGETWSSGKGPHSLNFQSDCADMLGQYTFTIYDSHGDGICCEHGNGSYEVRVGDVVVASGGKFGWSETKSFKIV